MPKKIFYIFTIFTFFAILSTSKAPNSQVLAQSEGAPIQYEKINPDNNYQYNLKRLKEKIILTFYSLWPEKKGVYYQNLLSKRLAELKYIVDNKNLAHIQKSSQRYASTAGESTEYVIKNNLNNQKINLIEILNKHLSSINSFKNNFGSETAEWRFVQYNSDYLNTYILQLSE